LSKNLALLKHWIILFMQCTFSQFRKLEQSNLKDSFEKYLIFFTKKCLIHHNVISSSLSATPRRPHDRGLPSGRHDLLGVRPRRRWPRHRRRIRMENLLKRKRRRWSIPCRRSWEYVNITFTKLLWSSYYLLNYLLCQTIQYMVLMLLFQMMKFAVEWFWMA